MERITVLAKLGKEALTQTLQDLQLIPADEMVLKAAPAGDGNMNFTLRVQTNLRSLIVKQSVPYVAKYPTITAPENRILQELAFYRHIELYPAIAARMPQVITENQAARIVAFEDCGDSPDYTSIYTSDTPIPTDTIDLLIEWLAKLHSIELSPPQKQEFSNSEMRKLNHFHIFDFPLNAKNGFNLDAVCPGLAQAARSIQQNTQFKRIAERIGDESYLRSGDHLVHGDFFPGSILKTELGPKIIDPEFCHCGCREFDLGVFLAHLHISKSSCDVGAYFIDQSSKALPFKHTLTYKIAGVEIMRRIIGVAQLPFDIDLERRIELLDLAQEFVLN